jgi:uncharacterized protein YceH (UPF0502 family)
MAIDLDPLQQRIVGALIEKETTVPESYPLTLNALVSAVNQKSNREPEIHAEDYEVEGALRSLMEKGRVVQMEREGGRTLRYSHAAGTPLGVDDADLAILAELMNRGPQTPAELKTRASRMRPLPSAEDVERRLQALAARPIPYVKLLGRRPREHAARWGHLLGPSPASAEVASPTASTPRPTPTPPSAAPSLADRVAALERSVAEVRSRLGL